jgi:hypothetical protein
MPEVYLNDDELAEFVTERPDIIGMAIQKLVADLAEERSHSADLYRMLVAVRQELKELKGENK